MFLKKPEKVVNSNANRKRNKLAKIALVSAIMLNSSSEVFSQSMNVEGAKAIAGRFSPNTNLTPNSESVQKKEHSGVDMFHGCATVNIPLYTLQGDAMKYNIGLSYYSGGIRVNEMPGMMGMSWSLDGESQITRTVNGSPDEMYNFAWKDNGQVFERGYYFFGSQFNTSDWNTSTFLDDHNDPLKSGPNHPIGSYSYDGQPDEFQFNFAGHSGSFFRSETGEWKVKSKENLDLKIEEVLYTYDYNQSTFYQYNHNNWKSPGEMTSYHKPNVATLFTQFTLTAPDGYKYIFGGVDSAIEFTRGMLKDPGDYINSHMSQARTANTWKLSKIVSPLGEEIKFTYNRGKVQFQRSKNYLYGAVEGTNWNDPEIEFGLTAINPVYLNSIETSRGILYFKHSQAVEKWFKPLPTLGCPLTSEKENIFNKIDYCTAAFIGDGDYLLPYLYQYPTVNLPNFNQQLDSLVYFDKISQSYVDGYKFVQSANPNTRRTLDELYRFNFKDTKTDSKYSFTYNNVGGLPELDALSKDYWDFYNSTGDDTACGMSQSMLQDFHSAFSLDGMLTKIVNPLGGSTEFTYEGNSYAKKVDVNLTTGTMDIENVAGMNNYGPGCRVKQIKHVDIFGAPAVTKNYFYHNNYPSTDASGYSGILNFDPTDDIIKINKCFGSTYNNFYLTNFSTVGHKEFTKLFKGGVVNYSTVTEVNADSSYTTYKFSNLDNAAYRDELHSGYYSVNIYQDRNFRLSSTDMDRGNLLNSTDYNADGDIVKEVINTYDYSPARKNKFIKASDRRILYYLTSTCNGGGLVNLRVWAFKYYYYNTPLIKTEERLYNAEGDYAATETEYSYDAYGNLISKSQTTSDGAKITTDIKYNSHSDYNGNATDAVGLGLKNLLQQYGIKNYPVEKITKKSSINPAPGALPKVLGAELYTYGLYKPLSWQKYATEFTEPVSVYDNAAAPNGFKASEISGNSFVMDSRYKLQENIAQYSSGANNTYPKVLTRINNSMPSATTWDFKGLLPSSQTQNAAYSEIAYAGFEGDYSNSGAEYKNGWDYNGTSFQIASPAKAMAGTGALTVSPSLTATAANAVIKTNLTLASGKKYTLAFWATRPSGVEYYAANGNSVQFLSPKRTLSNGWFYYETEVTAISGQPVGIVCYGTGGLANALIDEVMFCPAVASMQSLSYDTRSGQITAQNNGSGQILYFEYDGLGRMIKTTDEQGILIKTQEYTLQDN